MPSGLKLSPELRKTLEETGRKILKAQADVASGKVKIEDTNLFVPKSNAKRDAEGKVIRNRPKKYKKTKLVVGMKFGDLILRRKLPPKKGVKPSLRERWRVECTAPNCGKELEVPKYYLIRKPNPKTHCGCRFATLKSKNKREFLIYHMMHQRCENPNHASYEHYRKNGITIWPEWHKSNSDGFEKWFEEVGPSPTKYHSLDRIDNRKGYIPGNLRWSTSEEQRMNQGDTIGGKTAEEIEAMNMTEEQWIEFVKENGYQ